MDTVDPRHEPLATKLDQANREHNELTERLHQLDLELERSAKQSSVYAILDSVSEQLQQLHDMGEAKLFWGNKYTTEEELLAHVGELKVTADFFNAKFDVIRNKRSALEKDLQGSKYRIALIQDQIDEEKLLEEESKHDFVIKRVYEPLPFRPMDMPWYKKGEDEKRYKRYVLLALSYSVLLGLLIPMWQLPIPDRAEVVKVPERFAQLLKKEEPPPPPPEKEPELTELEKKPSETKPTEKEVKEVRKKVSNAGVLAFKDNFSDLLNEVPEAQLGANAQLSMKGANAKSATRSLVTSSAQSGSGGIKTASLSRNVGTAGGNIGSAKFSRVSSDISTAVADDRPLSDGPGPSRTDEEIQIVFDRYKAALYRIYNRELRINPSLQGNMVLRLTIQPNGSVTSCKIESSDMDSASLSAGIIERVKRFNFGAKDNVPAITILYPIDFLPAS